MPSEVLAEDANLMRLLAIEALGRPKRDDEDGDEGSTYELPDYDDI